MADILILVVLLAASGGLGWYVRGLTQAQKHLITTIGQSHLSVTASLAALDARQAALEAQQDALRQAVVDAGQRITNFSFPPLPEPKVVTVEVPVKQGVTQQVIAAPPRKQVCLVLMDRDEKTVDGIMWVPPHKRAHTVTRGESKYTCASGSVAEGHFVYREVA